MASSGKRVPRATYRIQFRSGFGFAEARRVVPYLRALGVDTLYASPLFRAREGSTHGYDVADPRVLDPALGTPEEWDALVEELRRNELGLLLDVVPNHMAASADNPWWWDALRGGRDSDGARFFDIEWDAPGAGGTVLLPVLGAPYGEVLARGELRVEAAEVRYHDHRFPIAGGARGSVHDVLERQHYRLAHWRLASYEINYRRFFDISDLVALRAEDSDVFEQTHTLVRELVARGVVTGVRVDHVDGLTDPGAYLQRLAGLGTYLVVEKILARDERLPKAWPVDGTTGYEHVAVVEDLFVDAGGWRALIAAAAAFAAAPDAFDDAVYRAKRDVLDRLFAAEVAGIAREIHQLAREDLRARDLPAREIERAVAELTACLGVYRIYGGDDRAERARIRRAFEDAQRRAGDLPAAWFVRRVVTLEDVPASERDRWARVARRWQQLTGPAMAKGFEDTALYRWVPLVSRNDVGGEPGEPPRAPADVHEWLSERARTAPRALTAGSTHDSKRSEDVRARLHVLSEIPDEWAAALRRWRRAHAALRAELPQGTAPSGSDELLLYQTIVGVWPLDRADETSFGDRVEAYAVKAAREAKLRTCWLDPDEEYERALTSFARGVLRRRAFVRDVRALLDRIALPGVVNSLAQLVLRVCAPGVPDVYQGTELWSFLLVDPDNRKPVDYELRARLLDEMKQREAEDLPGLLRDLTEEWRDGRIKMWVLRAALRARAEQAALFERGRYEALSVRGSDHVFAFARRSGRSWAIVAVPRLVAADAAGAIPVAEAWRAERIVLPSGAPDLWRNELTGDTVRARRGVVRAAEAFARLPVAVLAPVRTSVRSRTTRAGSRPPSASPRTGGRASASSV